MADDPAPSSAWRRSSARVASLRIGRSGRSWIVAASIISGLAIAPILALVWIAVVHPTANAWPHLLATVLPSSAWTTALLLGGVCIVVLVVGTSTAWLVTMYEFPGRRVFDWLLAVPLAMPTYLSAFAYIEIWDYAGPIQTTLRQLFGWTSARDYWFPDIRTLGGAILILSFALYPYVYLTARGSFAQTPAQLLDASRALGHSALETFWRVALPLARPALAAGATLALMECLNDIGAVGFLGVRTLTVSVYNTWLERNNLGGAAQLACVMLLFVMALLWLERLSRKQQRYHATGRPQYPVARRRLGPAGSSAAILGCTLPIAIGFGTPFFVFLSAAFTHWQAVIEPTFWGLLRNSVLLSAIGAALTVAAGLVLVYARRSSASMPLSIVTRLASLGYAVPGTVLGLGILVPLAAMDNFVDGWMRSLFGVSTGLLVTGSAGAIVIAYAIRFLAMSQGSIEAGFSRLSPNLDAAARNLGRTPRQVLWEIHLPLIRPALGAAAVLVFVDAMKELPATLLLRPFDFDTLATHVYTLASFDMFEEASLSALAIVAVGCLPVFLLQRLLIARAA
ncbi:ABC transporter permease [Rhodoligotrophos defluvii]|uniref:ABC transporter permease n=1 Tax=Rhodoligotrophos defluvii TaxID=2561934 RepID=UPI0010C998A2|nr:iron ABC transporter permease [Rhodoligotrophos defluvii]